MRIRPPSIQDVDASKASDSDGARKVSKMLAKITTSLNHMTSHFPPDIENFMYARSQDLGSPLFTDAGHMFAFSSRSDSPDPGSPAANEKEARAETVDTRADGSSAMEGSNTGMGTTGRASFSLNPLLACQAVRIMAHCGCPADEGDEVSDSSDQSSYLGCLVFVAHTA